MKMKLGNAMIKTNNIFTIGAANKTTTFLKKTILLIKMMEICFLYSSNVNANPQVVSWYSGCGPDLEAVGRRFDSHPWQNFFASFESNLKIHNPCSNYSPVPLIFFYFEMIHDFQQFHTKISAIAR